MRKMNAKFGGRCKDCGATILVGDAIRWSKATGAVCAEASDCRDMHDMRAESMAERRMESWAAHRHEGLSSEQFHENWDYEREDARREMEWEAREIAREEAEYQKDRDHEVRQIQEFAPAGSELREQMYLELEMAAYNRGEDY